jgi:hypothetical protein
MCLGGHLVSPSSFAITYGKLIINLTPAQAFRAAFDPRVLSAVCFFATDIHSATLGAGGDDSLKRVQAGALSHSELVVSISRCSSLLRDER